MSTSKHEDLESADDDLVAYLDGELPAEVTRHIENRLAGDADYRDQLRELDQAWEALDALPRTNAGDNFARTTIAMVVQEAESDLAKRSANAAKVGRLRRLRSLAIGLLAVAASFTAASIFLPNEDTRLLKDLPVIRQYDLLAGINDIEFLREVSQRFSTDQLTRDSIALAKEVDAITKAGDPILKSREQWVRDSPEEKQELWAQEDRFFELTENRQQQLRELEQRIAADKDADKLRETLVAYSQWLANKRENVQWQLRKKELTTAERVAIIDRIVHDEGLLISDAEQSRLKAEIRAIAEEHKEAILKAYVTGGGDPEKLRKSFEQPSIGLELYTVYWALNNDEKETAAKTRKRLADQLDTETRQLLASRSDEPRGANARDPLWTLIFEAIPMRGKPDPNELMRFFAKDLKNEQRKRLSESSPAEFEARLTQMYNTMMMMDPGFRDDLQERIGLRLFGGRQGRGDGGGGGQRGRRGGSFGEGMQFGPGSDMRGGFDGGPRGDRGRGRGQRGDRGGRGGPPDDEEFFGRRGGPGERGPTGERGPIGERGEPGAERGQRPAAGPGEIPPPEQQDQPK